MTVRRHLTEYALDAEAARTFLHEIMPIGAGELPTEVRGWREASGRIRRVRALYPNGWTLQFTVSVRGVIGRVRATCSVELRPQRFAA